MSTPLRDAARGSSALPDDRRVRAENRRWAEVRRAVREAKELDLYAVEVRGVKATLRLHRPSCGRAEQRPEQSSVEVQPTRAGPSARQAKQQQRSRDRKDAFHAKKRAEAAASVAEPPQSQDGQSGASTGLSPVPAGVQQERMDDERAPKRCPPSSPVAAASAAPRAAKQRVGSPRERGLNPNALTFLPNLTAASGGGVQPIDEAAFTRTFSRPASSYSTPAPGPTT